MICRKECETPEEFYQNSIEVLVSISAKLGINVDNVLMNWENWLHGMTDSSIIAHLIDDNSYDLWGKMRNNLLYVDLCNVIQRLFVLDASETGAQRIIYHERRVLFP